MTKTSGGMMVMNQGGLIGRIAEAMGEDIDHSTPKSTLYLKAPLNKDVDDDPCSESFEHVSIVDMLLCLSAKYCPDISYSVSQVVRSTSCPVYSHEAVLKLIRRHLLRTKNKALFYQFNHIFED